MDIFIFDFLQMPLEKEIEMMHFLPQYMTIIAPGLKYTNSLFIC